MIFTLTERAGRRTMKENPWKPGKRKNMKISTYGLKAQNEWYIVSKNEARSRKKYIS
jgi:hypothetical protein